MVQEKDVSVRMMENAPNPLEPKSVSGNAAGNAVHTAVSTKERRMIQTERREDPDVGTGHILHSRLTKVMKPRSKTKGERRWNNGIMEWGKEIADCGMRIAEYPS